ncbi:MAG: hypothetical protein K2I68_00745, partial [Bacteroidales bacterium]|nr:hypothetical protein [Bacteroidales bacterium]
QDPDREIEPMEQLCTRIVKEPVAWQPNGNRLDYSPGQIYKYGGCGCWVNGGVVSKQRIEDNGSVSFTPGYVGGHRMVGLSTHTRITGYGYGWWGYSWHDYDYAALDYAIYFNTRNLEIYEGGRYIGSFGRYYTSDQFMIEVADSVVRYFRNNELFYTSTRRATSPLYVKANMHCIGTWVPNIYVEYRVTDRKFTANATNTGTAPRYQWILNGKVVKDAIGDNTFYVKETTPYTFLRDGDELNCIVTSSYDCVKPVYKNNQVQLEDPIRFVENVEYPEDVELLDYDSRFQYITPDTSVCYGDTITLATGRPGTDFKWEFLMGDAYDTIYELDSVYKYDSIPAAWSPKFWVPIYEPGTQVQIGGYWDSIVIEYHLDSTFLGVETVMNLVRQALPIYESELKVAPKRDVTYRAWASDPSGCSNNFRRVSVKVYPEIKMNIGPDSLWTCAGGSVPLRIRQSSLKDGFTYEWKSLVNGWTSGVINKLDSTVYHSPAENDTVEFHVITNVGCDYFDTLTVTVNPLPTPYFLPRDTSVCFNQPVVFADTNTYNPKDTYTWTPASKLTNVVTNGSQVRFISADSGTFTYVARGRSQYGCIAYDTVRIHVDKVKATAYLIDLDSIQRSRDTICNIDTVTYIVKGENWGENPTFAWYFNGVKLPAYHSDTLRYSGFSDKSTIRCIVTPSADICPDQAQVPTQFITMTVFPIDSNTVQIESAEGLKLVSDTLHLCAYDTTALFTSTYSLASVDPRVTYCWLLNGDTVSFSRDQRISGLKHGDMVSIRTTSGLMCAVPRTATDSIAIVVYDPVQVKAHEFQTVGKEQLVQL